jgi:hypothetical protein
MAAVSQHRHRNSQQHIDQGEGRPGEKPQRAVGQVEFGPYARQRDTQNLPVQQIDRKDQRQQHQHQVVAARLASEKDHGHPPSGTRFIETRTSTT